MTYNTRNIDKYKSKNPLKQLMLKIFFNKLQKIINEINTKKDTHMSLLDVGCGEGVISNFLYDNFNNLDITAVDFCSEMIEVAKAKNPRKIKFEIGDIKNLKYSIHSFDVVLATEVLEHINIPKKALEECVRVARKSIVLSVPREPYFCLGNLLTGKNVKHMGNPTDHINHWTKGGFKKFLTETLSENYKIKLYNCYVWTIAVVENVD